MNIVVLGAGTVGTSIADMLCQQNVSVTVVDEDPDHTRQINTDLDVRAICGSASQSSILFQTGISTADVCLAVTGNDEVNIVAASMAKAMGARRSIARVYAPIFRDLSTFDYQRHFNIDSLLSLEHLTAMELARGIRDPGSVVVEQFARGELEVHELYVGNEGPITRKNLRDLGMPANVKIGTIQRGNRMWIASADDQLQTGDRINIFSRPEDMGSVRSFFKKDKAPHRRVVIAGGGETGFHLARTLERERFSVMLMESDPSRAEFLANALKETVVVLCDATRKEILEEERVGGADFFVACIGDDENNIMAGVEAREIGAGKILAVIGRPDYANVVGKLGIDLAVSEREVMAKQILAYLNDGVVVSRTQLPGGTTNVLEIEVTEGCQATQHSLADLKLPERCLVVAVIQHNYVRVPIASDRLQPGDLAVLLIDQDILPAALPLFEPQ